MTALILLRLVEYAAAALLFGAPLFLIYSRLETLPGLSPLIRFSALVLTIAAPVHFGMQTAQIADAALDFATLKASFLQLAFGKACLVRGVAALLALCFRKNHKPTAMLGVIACASFAWMGHGAATEGALGWVHVANDIAHTLAASAWIGALAVFIALLARKNAWGPALLVFFQRFSAFGIAFVTVLLVTGIINSLFMLNRLANLWQSIYGVVLLAKIALFLMMLALAARNHALAQTTDSSLPALRRSVLTETGLGFIVLGLVAVLGTLSPPSLP